MNLKNIDIAIIGESMSGKSTWLAHLFPEKITEKLKAICEFNKEGQTKITTYYTVYGVEEQDLHVLDIGWNFDTIEKISSSGKESIALQKIGHLFNITDENEIMDYISQGLNQEFYQSIDVLRAAHS